MAMTSAGRRDAIYAAIASANPNFSKLSQSEKDTLKASIGAVWGDGDLPYITANAQVNPGSLNNPAGQPVSTTGGPAAQTGFTTAPEAIAGLGTVS